jgi:Uma2 family endonuclease
MSPIGNPHAAAVANLTRILVLGVGTRAVVWPQGPLRVPPRSMPQPDLALLRSRSYRTTGAHPDDVMLVVEVSDTSLTFDRTTKLRLYASAGVPEYWIADTTQTALEVYRDAVGNGYRDRLAVPSSGTIAPLHFPDVIIAVADIFA